MNNITFVACWGISMSYFAPDFGHGFSIITLVALIVGAIFLDYAKS